MIEAYLMIMTATGTAGSLLPAIRELDGVRRANIVAGEFDIIAVIQAESQQDLLSLVTDDIHSLDGVGRTRTSIVLS